MASVLGLARRAGWNVIDQVMSALSNMLLVIVVARATDATAMGEFAIGFLIYGIAVAVGKAVVGQPLQMRHSADSPTAFRNAVRRSQGMAIVVGLLFSLACLVGGLVVGGSLATVLYALVPVLPALVVQDSMRMAFFANGRAEHAALIDFVRVVLQFGLLFAAIGIGWTQVGLLTLTWGIAGLVSALVGLWLVKATPSLPGARVWAAEQKDITGYLIAEYVLGLGAAQFGILMIAPLSSPADVGAIRAVQTLLGPLNVLGTAAFGFAIPELSRRAHLPAASRITAMTAVSGLMGLVAAVYVGILLVLPDPAGQALFHDSWTGAAPVLLPMGLNSIASSLGLGAAVTLYGMGLARKTFHLNILRAPILLALMALGTLRWGAVGAAAALAVVETLFLPFWVIAAVRASHRRDAGDPEIAQAAQAAADATPAAEGDMRP